MIWAAVALAGALGSTLRLLTLEIGKRIAGGHSPWTAWVLNCSACFALGVVLGLSIEQGLSPDVVAVIGSGLIGSYAIVSPLTYDALVIGIQGSWPKAFIHSVGAILACITSASIGLLICGAL